MVEFLIPSTGNTRVISQTALDRFRESLTTRKDDPYSVLLRRNKLPMALLDDAANPHARKVSRSAPMTERVFHFISSVRTSWRQSLSVKRLGRRRNAKSLG